MKFFFIFFLAKTDFLNFEKHIMNFFCFKGLSWFGWFYLKPGQTVISYCTNSHAYAYFA